MRVAAVTMAYNEAAFLPLWGRHYARQVGAQNLHLLDHGSDDGSVEAFRAAYPEARIVTLPRSPVDEPARAAAVAEYCASLLGSNDAVVHSDVDELLVAEPRFHDDLTAYAASHPPPVTTAVGVDLHHLPGEEPPLDPARPLGEQRRWVRFSAAMCKPALTRKPIKWSPGFHSADAPLALDQLYLIHLRYADLGLGLARLARTRAQPVADPAANAHQRVPDEAFESLMRRVAALPRHAAVPFDPALPPLERWVAALRRSRAAREGELYKLDLSLAGDELWELPERFRAVL